MSHHRPADAVRAYAALRRRAVSCVSPFADLVVDGVAPGVVHAATLEFPLALPRDPRLSVREWFRVTRRDDGRAGFSVAITGYAYRFALAGAELFAYHWHPDGPSPYRAPHLHVRLAALGNRPHLPTGHVAIEDILAFLVADLGVRPLREDWNALLAESRDRIREWATWA